MSKRFYSFSPDDGIVWWDTQEQAQARAERELAACRATADFEGEWPQEVEFVQWGEVMRRAAPLRESDGDDWRMTDTAGSLRETVRACRDGLDALQKHIGTLSDPHGEDRALAYDLLRRCAVALGEATDAPCTLTPFTRETAATIERDQIYRVREKAWNAQSTDRFRDGMARVLDVRPSRVSSTGLQVKVNPIGTTANIWIDASWLADPAAERTGGTAA